MRPWILATILSATACQFDPRPIKPAIDAGSAPDLSALRPTVDLSVSPPDFGKPDMARMPCDYVNDPFGCPYGYTCTQYQLCEPCGTNQALCCTVPGNDTLCRESGTMCAGCSGAWGSFTRCQRQPCGFAVGDPCCWTCDPMTRWVQPMCFNGLRCDSGTVTCLKN